MAQPNPAFDPVIAAIGVTGIVLLARWLGNGSVLLGFWLFLLSIGFICSFFVLGFYVIASEAALGNRMIAGAIAGVLFVLCSFALKQAEGRRTRQRSLTLDPTAALRQQASSKMGGKSGGSLAKPKKT
jgi:hypothetical protein